MAFLKASLICLKVIKSVLNKKLRIFKTAKLEVYI